MLSQAERFLDQALALKRRWTASLDSHIDYLDGREPTPQRKVSLLLYTQMVESLDTMTILNQDATELNEFIRSTKKESERWIELLTQEMIALDATKATPERKEKIVSIQDVIGKLEREFIQPS